MPTGWRLTVSNLFCIPQRWVIGIMGFTCMAVAYMLRVCLNISITQMVMVKIKNKTSSDEFECPASGPLYNYTTDGLDRYDWDEYTQGIILSSFYYGYLVTHIPAGWLSERYGAKHLLGFGIFITSILTIATPTVVESGGAPALIVARILEGLAEGPTSPALAALMSRWVPKSERGRMGSLIFGGAQIGNIAGTLVSGFLLADGNWHRVFHTFGIVGIVWFIAWCIFVYSDPGTHPFISDEEKTFLQERIEPKKKGESIPWLPMLTSLPLWAIVIGAIGHDWGYFTMVTDLPKYMVDVMKFDVKNTGLLVSLPYALMWVMSFVFGVISDFLIKRQYLSVKNVRKVFTTIASVIPGIFIVMASHVGCDHSTSVLMFCLAMATMGAYYSGMKVNILDISPNFAGTGTAIINGIGCISGIITPYLVGLLTPDQSHKQWQIVFWISFAVLTITDVIYCLFADGEVLWWNDVEQNFKANIEMMHMNSKTNDDDEQADDIETIAD